MLFLSPSTVVFIIYSRFVLLFTEKKKRITEKIEKRESRRKKREKRNGCGREKRKKKKDKNKKTKSIDICILELGVLV